MKPEVSGAATGSEIVRRLERYCRGRREVIEASIACERLAGNAPKEMAESTALAEITGFEIWMARGGLSQDAPVSDGANVDFSMKTPSPSKPLKPAFRSTGMVQRPPDASREALAGCLRWIEACRELGWEEADMDSLEGLWWQHHDNSGNRKPLNDKLTRCGEESE